MSDILIKGIEMPRSCQECPCEQCYVNNYGYVICRECPLLYKGYTTAFGNERREDCPLIEIPSHGRLIDADALCISLERLAADKWNQKAAPVNWAYVFEECLEMVDNAPTIIEQNFIKEPTSIPAEESNQ